MHTGILCPDPGGGNPRLDAETRIVELLGLPGRTPWCLRAPPMRLRSHTGAKEKVVKPTCKCWTCDRCAATMNREWGRHLGVKLLRSEGSLFWNPSPAERWGADLVRLKRMGASWARIGCPGAEGTVIGSARPSFGMPLNDWELAVATLGAALRGLEVLPRHGGRVRPITCSADWRRPTEPTKYDRIGWVRCSRPERLMRSLLEIGIEATCRPADAGGIVWDVSWLAPLDSPDRMARLDAVLSSSR